MWIKIKLPHWHTVTSFAKLKQDEKKICINYWKLNWRDDIFCIHHFSLNSIRISKKVIQYISSLQYTKIVSMLCGLHFKSNYVSPIFQMSQVIKSKCLSIFISFSMKRVCIKDSRQNLRHLHGCTKFIESVLLFEDCACV